MKKNIFTSIMAGVLLTVSNLVSAQNTTTYSIGHYLKSINSTETVTVRSVAYDHSGNLYVIGTFKGTITFNNADHFICDDGAGDVFFAKFDRQGQAIWEKVGGSASFGDEGVGIAVDGNNNVYVTAYTGGSDAVFGSTAPDNGTYQFSNIIMAKLDSAGTYQWVKGGGQLTPEGIFIDKNNTVYLVGSGGNAKTFAGVAFTDPEDHQFTGFVLAVDSNGTMHQHRQIFNDNSVFGVTGDTLGNLYIVGEYDHTLQIDSGIDVLNSIGTNYGGFISSYVAKLSSNNLSVTWARSPYASYQNEVATVALDSFGNVYTGGFYEDSVIISNTQTWYSGGFQSAIIKYNNNGDLQWAHAYGVNEQTGGDVYRLAYDKHSNKLWATMLTDYDQPFGLDTIHQTLAIANIDMSNGNLLNIIQSSTDGAGKGKGLAVHNGLVGVGGSFKGGSPGTSNQFTLFTNGIPYVSNDQGFITEFTDTTVTTGIETMQLGDATVTMYPNPSHGNFTVKVSDELIGGIVAINNLIGQTITEQQLTSNTQQLSLQNIAQGMYLVTIKTTNGSITKKLTVQ